MSDDEVQKFVGWLQGRMGDLGSKSVVHSETLQEVLLAYGDLTTAEVRRLVEDYLREHRSELRHLLAAQQNDSRRPPLLSDPALPCILERLEHDKYALRSRWIPKHNLRELRRLADFWGVQISL